MTVHHYLITMLPGRIGTADRGDINGARGPVCSDLAQVVGKVGIKGQPVVPFGIDGVQGAIRQHDDMLSEQIQVHVGKQGAQICWRGRLPCRWHRLYWCRLING